MKVRCLLVFFTAFVCLLIVPVQARADKGDVYFGYSRTGANLYAVYTPGMNGWQAAAHFKPLPFIGIEGDISRYTQTSGGFTQQVTLAMFGPRVTAHAAGFSVFAHGLGGVAHQHGTLVFYPSVGYNAASYAIGGGVDVPLLLKFKLRATGDYLGNGNAPSGSYSPSYYRFGVGVACHF